MWWGLMCTSTLCTLDNPAVITTGTSLQTGFFPMLETNTFTPTVTELNITICCSKLPSTIGKTHTNVNFHFFYSAKQDHSPPDQLTAHTNN